MSGLQAHHDGNHVASSEGGEAGDAQSACVRASKVRSRVRVREVIEMAHGPLVQPLAGVSERERARRRMNRETPRSATGRRSGGRWPTASTARRARGTEKLPARTTSTKVADIRAKWGLIFAIQAKPFAEPYDLSPVLDTRIFAVPTPRAPWQPSAEGRGAAFQLASDEGIRASRNNAVSTSRTRVMGRSECTSFWPAGAQKNLRYLKFKRMKS